jgi:hypothetical protein
MENPFPQDREDAESANTPQDVMLDALHPSPLEGENSFTRHIIWNFASFLN